MTQLVIHRTGDSRADASPLPSVAGTLHPIRSYDGAELAVLVAGDGPPLVLVHGSLVSSASWALMWRPLLDAGYRLIAYDLLPKRLLAPVLFTGLIGRVLRRPRSGRAFARTLFGDDPDADHVEFTRRLLAATPDATKVQAPKAVLNYNLTGRLAGARMPTLLVHGERDRNVTANHVDLLLRELPHARLTTYERAGHMLVLERAGRFTEDVDAFARHVLAGSRQT